MKIWLLRHGATEWARNGRHTGRTDLPLLPEGEEEARRLAPLLAGERFDAVLVSPLQRARRTCELAGQGDRAEVCEDLREWDYGDYEGITTAEIRRTCPGWTVWSQPCPGGESASAVEQRCLRLIDTCLTRVGREEQVALFAHGHLLRALAGCWIGLGVRGGSLLALDTGSFCVLGQEREQRVLLRWNAPVAVAAQAQR